MPIASGTLVELFLRDPPRLVILHDLEFVHVVLLPRLQLVLEHPPGRLPDVLVHGGRRRADHPAVAVAAADLRAHGLRPRRAPQLVPRLGVEVAHDLLILGTVTGHDVAVRVDEERVERHVARKQPRLAVDVVDEPVVEVSSEPFFGTVRFQEFVYQVLDALRHHRPVVDDVLRLHKVEAVVQARRGELHAQLVGYAVERNEVGGVAVLNGHAEADVRVPHLYQLLERRVPALVAVLEAANLIVGPPQALDRDTDPHFGEFIAQLNDAIGEEPVGRDDDAIRFLVELADDIGEVGPDERLPTGHVGEVHGRELPDRLDRDLVLRPARRLVAVAHVAPCVAAVRDDHGSVELLIGHQSLLV